MPDTIVILNAHAGTILDRGADTIRAMIAEALSGRGGSVEIVLAEGPAFLQAIDAAARSGPPMLIVGGGDGSAGHAVRRLAGTDRVLGLLPLGTLNLFARSLGMPADIAPALAALGDAVAAPVDLAAVNGRIFHTFAGLGFFAEMARARARMRGETSFLPFGRYIAVARSSFRAFSRTGQLELTLESAAGRETVTAYALVVSNNRLAASRFDRLRLDEGVLEVHVAEGAETARRMQAGLDLLAGSWRDNPDIRSIVTTTISVGSHRPRLWLSVDGELVRLATPLRFEIMPAALKVLRPAVATGPGPTVLA
ncbi:diacylglycerol kinase family protein [Kaistia dalseonensis]|uniref:Diacylglycerol kinase family enzyme n=1 Tax=Kaistia dalseonensis TaxID=410840 RepID=A0ABU0HC63_9HYPH|nr:diacylglycerol kinase family protein [Kaistia dalseonensis]MCX5497263.1 diacylglycerol kinase family protein [Kaistia dalseonensis]MDQ0439899.1 diacylglycerol kinase family enzyme [Kaistia dalseonensis]